MNRRTFLRATVLGSALTTAPGWFAKAWAAPSDGTLRIFDAYRRAKRQHRALLVFVVPDDRAERYARGGGLGAYLNHASDHQLAPLALCEIVCATMEELHSLSPAKYVNEPSFVLIETVVGPAKARHARITFKSTRDIYAAAFGAEVTDSSNTSPVDENTDNIAKAIRQLVMPKNSVSPSMLKGRDAAAEKLLLRSIANTPGNVDLSHVDRNAAGLMQAALKIVGVRRAAIMAALAASAVVRIRDKPVAGARWAQASGCGPSLYEDEKDDERARARSLRVLCGMGHIPEKSGRFLSFLVDQPKK